MGNTVVSSVASGGNIAHTYIIHSCNMPKAPSSALTALYYPIPAMITVSIPNGFAI